MHLYMYTTCVLYMESGQPFTGDGLDFENWDNIPNPRSLQPVLLSIVYPQHGHSAASCKTRWKDFYGINNSNFNELIDQWKTENLTDGVKEQTKLHIWVLLRFNVSIIMEIYIYRRFHPATSVYCQGTGCILACTSRKFQPQTCKKQEASMIHQETRVGACGTPGMLSQVL